MAKWTGFQRRARLYESRTIDNEVPLPYRFCATFRKTTPYKFLTVLQPYVGTDNIFDYDEVYFSSVDIKRTERNKEPLGSNFLNWLHPVYKESILERMESAGAYQDRMFLFVSNMPIKLVDETLKDLKKKLQRDDIPPDDWAYYMTVRVYHGGHTIQFTRDHFLRGYYLCMDLTTIFAGFLVAYFKTKQPKRQLLLEWIRESPTFPRYPKCLCMEVAKYLGSG
jgi:hypothetical protein